MATSILCSTCGKSAQTNVDYGNEHGILFIANGDDPGTLDPHLATGLSEGNVIRALYEGLVSIDPLTMDIIPAVAERWEVSDDKRRYRFYLREQARWSNGEKLTSADFVASWKRVLDPESTSSFAYILHYIKNAEAYNKGEIQDFSEVGVSAPSPHILDLELASPTPFFLQVLDHFTYYPVYQTPGNELVGNGAFVLEEWNIDNNIKVTRNKAYWDADTLKLNGMVFFPIADKAVEERAFRTGQVHLTFTPRMAIEKVAVYKKEFPHYFQSTPLYASIYYNLNTTRAPFDDVKVRRALAMAIDRETIVDKVMKAGQTAAWSFIPPDPRGYKPQALFTYDPEQARQLLSEAGYPNGENFPSFDLLFVSSQLNHNLAVAVQHMWKQNLNIDVNLQNQEWKAYFNTRSTLDFDIGSGSWYADYLDPTNFFEVMYSFSGNNHTGWKNTDYDSLIDQSKKTDNANERNELFARANRILAEEMPVIPIFYPVNANMVHTSVVNWQQNPLARIHYKYVELTKTP